MPELPLSFPVNTLQQFKAISDPLRNRILSVIRHQPATAKQLADLLGASPGTVGHHLRVLEEAGLAKIVARRLVRGIVAKYYTRTARIFQYDLVEELVGEDQINLEFLNQMRDELLESRVRFHSEGNSKIAFPHARLTEERASYYSQRLEELVDEFLNEPLGTGDPVYSLGILFFKSPPYMQKVNLPADATPEESLSAESKAD
ncbi:MAG TPA: winged helix-turn-helix domain-containing protein [Chloroflexia bacterium]|nr:winged helix-turn-helix domain-containing protein [Chloroflexia bacterium]